MKSIRIIVQEDKIIDTICKTYYVNEEWWNKESEEWEVIIETITRGINSWDRAVEVAKYLLETGE